ncbi:hypothetical protein [Algoriphagus resistens]|nr:hypothetical protein [Algoriphagus resistens]
MNLEQLNVVELSSEELVETTGGYTRSELDMIFIVVATDKLVEMGWNW